ncbi:hypothetical protein Godav_004053, partial [Gossypium davidsonii]|nr:hypothetical protein [Gossypium davidsonii]
SIEEDFVVDSAVRAKSTVVWGVWKRFGSAFTYWYGGDGMARRSGRGDAYNAGKLWHPHRGVTIANLGVKRFLFHFLMRLILKGYWMEALDAQQSFITFSSFTGRIDVRKPLIRRKKLLLGNKGYTYARFQYEKLLVFYFLCGRLGHSE